jgi:hypothetical protein
MRHLATILITLLLAVPAMSVELFRYRGATKDGGTLEYVFEAGEQNSPNAITKEKAAEIAPDFMTTFYHVQVGALGNVLCPKWRNVSSQWRNAAPGGKSAYRSSEKRPAAHRRYSTKWFLS